MTVQTPPEPPAPGVRTRRICLFAGFDVDGIIDDTVVAYLRDLSRFADVYYLADCPLEAGELDKLAPYTKGRWAIRHGRYDFGSYSMLARDLVGWDVIETVRRAGAGQRQLLPRPALRPGLRHDGPSGRRTGGGCRRRTSEFTTRDYERRGGPLGLDRVEDLMRQLDLWRYSDFIHVGSYFLVVPVGG